MTIRVPGTPTWMYVYNDGSFVSNSGAVGIVGANWSTPADGGESVHNGSNQPQKSLPALDTTTQKYC